jgi:hypothetical protein
MEEKDLIEQLKALKSIKPDEHWVFATKMSLMGQIVAKERDLKPTFASFLGSRSMKLTYSLVVLAMFMGGFTAFAKNSLPGDKLYAFKLSAQKAIIAIAPQSQKTNLKLAFAQDKIMDLQKAKNPAMAEILAQGVAADLNEVSSSIKSETNPRVALSASKSVKAKTEKMLASLSTAPSKSQEAVDKITESVNKTNAQAYAIMVGAQDKINSCPSYILDEFNLIKLYVSNVEPTSTIYNDLTVRLSEASAILSSASSDHCIDALVILDKLVADYKITLIPSASSGQAPVTTIPETTVTTASATTIPTSPVTSE